MYQYESMNPKSWLNKELVQKFFVQFFSPGSEPQTGHLEGPQPSSSWAGRWLSPPHCGRTVDKDDTDENGDKINKDDNGDNGDKVNNNDNGDNGDKVNNDDNDNGLQWGQGNDNGDNGDKVDYDDNGDSGDNVDNNDCDHGPTRESLG